MQATAAAPQQAQQSPQQQQSQKPQRRLTPAQRALIDGRKFDGYPLRVAEEKIGLSPRDAAWDEVVSTGFEALCLAALTFDPARPHPKKPGKFISFSSYAFPAVRRACYKAWKRLLARKDHFDSQPPLDVADGIDGQAEAEAGLGPFGTLQPLIDMLPPAQRPTCANGCTLAPEALSFLRMALCAEPPEVEAARGRGESWSVEEEAALCRMHRDGLLLAAEGRQAAAVRLGRDQKAVERKLARLRKAGMLPDVLPLQERAGMVGVAMLARDRQEAALAGWEPVSPDGFFGSPMWRHAATGRLAGEDEVLGEVRRHRERGRKARSKARGGVKE